MYDAIVIGARCAGSPTAMLLARRGYRVLLVDRATFPSNIMSGHYIQLSGVARLQHWGLLDLVMASNCPPVREFSFDFGPASFGGHPPAADGITEGYCPRRKVLDLILVDAAVEAGVEVREGFSVQEILRDGDRVIGIRGHTKNGAIVTEKARIVIGADGINSVVARTVEAPTYKATPSLTFSYYTYWSGVPVERGELYVRNHRNFGAIPTNDGLIMLWVAWTHKEFQEYRADIQGNYLKTLELAPALAERVRGGKREEPFIGTSNTANFFRKPFGHGWALVGDAGYHKDPILGQGITDAFRDAELLAEAIDVGFSERQPLSKALAAYEQRRNTAVMPMYKLNYQLAALEPLTPEMQQLFTALCSNQTEANRFFGAIAGTVSIPEFFSPANIERIIGLPNDKPSYLSSRMQERSLIQSCA